MTQTFSIRETGPGDVETIMDIERRAFGYEKEARLVVSLLEDASARPLLSLLALAGTVAVGHILFTRATFQGRPDSPLMHILAPLAVCPDYQRQGVGGLLIRTGIDRLRRMGSTLVFVLGHREYYPRYGFAPFAAKEGYLPPYPMPEEHGAYWMVQALQPDEAGTGKGTVRCADTLNEPQHWRDDETDR